LETNLSEKKGWPAPKRNGKSKQECRSKNKKGAKRRAVSGPAVIPFVDPSDEDLSPGTPKPELLGTGRPIV
jgi:hypothetical protein